MSGRSPVVPPLSIPHSLRASPPHKLVDSVADQPLSGLSLSSTDATLPSRRTRRSKESAKELLSRRTPPSSGSRRPSSRNRYAHVRSKVNSFRGAGLSGRSGVTTISELTASTGTATASRSRRATHRSMDKTHQRKSSLRRRQGKSSTKHNTSTSAASMRKRTHVASSEPGADAVVSMAHATRHRDAPRQKGMLITDSSAAALGPSAHHGASGDVLTSSTVLSRVLAQDDVERNPAAATDGYVVGGGGVRSLSRNMRASVMSLSTDTDLSRDTSPMQTHTQSHAPQQHSGIAMATAPADLGAHSAPPPLHTATPTYVVNTSPSVRLQPTPELVASASLGFTPPHRRGFSFHEESSPTHAVPADKSSLVPATDRINPHRDQKAYVGSALDDLLKVVMVHDAVERVVVAADVSKKKKKKKKPAGNAVTASATATSEQKTEQKLEQMQRQLEAQAEQHAALIQLASGVLPAAARPNATAQDVMAVGNEPPLPQSVMGRETTDSRPRRASVSSQGEGVGGRETPLSVRSGRSTGRRPKMHRSSSRRSLFGGFRSSAGGAGRQAPTPTHAKSVRGGTARPRKPQRGSLRASGQQDSKPVAGGAEEKTSGEKGDVTGGAETKKAVTLAGAIRNAQFLLRKVASREVTIFDADEQKPVGLLAKPVQTRAPQARHDTAASAPSHKEVMTENSTSPQQTDGDEQKVGIEDAIMVNTASAGPNLTPSGAMPQHVPLVPVSAVPVSAVSAGQPHPDNLQAAAPPPARNTRTELLRASASHPTHTTASHDTPNIHDTPRTPLGVGSAPPLLYGMGNDALSESVSSRVSTGQYGVPNIPPGSDNMPATLLSLNERLKAVLRGM